jgi:glycosyltransferase involved in cell wall biosynthesis
MYIFLERIAAPFTDRLIAVSTLNVEKGLQDKIGTRDRYTVIHSCINIEQFSRTFSDSALLKKSLGLNGLGPVVGTVSRLSHQKNPLDFVKMAALVKKQIPEAQFLFVGDGPLRSETEVLIRELNLQRDVVLAGLRKDVPELLRCLDIFTLTSLWEGLPRVIPQAMVAGLPVVANNIDGNAEIIQDGTNGFLITPGDTAGMADRVVQLVKDQELKRRISAKGHDTALRDFSLNDMVRKIAELYEELLSIKGVRVGGL